MMMQNRVIQEKIFALSKLTRNTENYYSCLKSFINRDLEYFQLKIEKYSKELINSNIEINNMNYYDYMQHDSNMSGLFSGSSTFNPGKTKTRKDRADSLNNEFSFISENDITEDKNQTRIIQEVFQHIKLLAEGHFYEMQNYLREQVHSKLSVNFIAVVVDYLETLYIKIKGLTDERSAEDLVINLNDEREEIEKRKFDSINYTGNVGEELVNEKMKNFNQGIDFNNANNTGVAFPGTSSGARSQRLKKGLNPIIMYDKVKYESKSNEEGPLQSNFKNTEAVKGKKKNKAEAVFDYHSQQISELNSVTRKRIKGAQFDFYLIYRHFAFMYYERFTSALDFLCELLQGPCEQNQEFIISTKIIDLLDKIMRETELFNSYNSDLDFLSRASAHSQKLLKRIKLNSSQAQGIDDNSGGFQAMLNNHINIKVNFVFQKIATRKILKTQKKKQLMYSKHHFEDSSDYKKNPDCFIKDHFIQSTPEFDNFNFILSQKYYKSLYLKIWEHYRILYSKIFKLNSSRDISNESNKPSHSINDVENDWDYKAENTQNFDKLGLEFGRGTGQQRQLLFQDISEYEKSMVLYKIGQLLLAIIEGKKETDIVVDKLLREFEITLLYDKITEIFLKLVNMQDGNGEEKQSSSILKEIKNIFMRIYEKKKRFWGKKTSQSKSNHRSKSNLDKAGGLEGKEEFEDDSYDLDMFSDDSDISEEENMTEKVLNISNSKGKSTPKNIQSNKKPYSSMSLIKGLDSQDSHNVSSTSKTEKKSKEALFKNLTTNFYNNLNSNIETYYDKPLEFFLYSKQNEHLIKKNNLTNKRIIVEAGLNFYFFLRQITEICDNESSDFQKLFNLFFVNFSKTSNNQPPSKASKHSSSNSDNYEAEEESSTSLFNNFSSVSERTNIHNNINIEIFYNYEFKFSFVMNAWAMNFFKKNCCEVEVVKNDNLHLVLFPKIYSVNDHSKELFMKFRENANRNSLMTKLMSIYTNYKEMYFSLKHLNSMERSFRRFWVFDVTLNNTKFFQYLSYALSLILNILILTGYSEDDVTEEERLEYGDRLKFIKLFLNLDIYYSRIVFLILGSLMLFSSFIVFAEFLTKRAPLIFRRYMRKKYIDEFESRRVYNELETRSFYQVFTLDKNMELRFKIMVVLQMFLKVEVLYAIISFSCTFLALIYHYFFFVFHLLDFIISQKPLLMIIRGILRVWYKLVIIFLLLLTFIYFYTLIVFFYFREIVPENGCNSLVSCYINLTNSTFASVGTIGAYFDNNSNAGVQIHSFGRYCLDISYTLIVSWIMIKMISAFFIDVFSSTREKTKNLQRDIDNICFICGLDRTTLDKIYLDKNGFNKHLEDHNLINYFSYLFYLNEKEFDELTGIESYTLERIKTESLDWFPLQRCIKMEKNSMY